MIQITKVLPDQTQISIAGENWQEFCDELESMGVSEVARDHIADLFEKFGEQDGNVVEARPRRLGEPGNNNSIGGNFTTFGLTVGG